MSIAVEATIWCDWLTDEDECEAEFHIAIEYDWQALEERVRRQGEARGWVWRSVENRREVWYCPLHKGEADGG